MDNAIKITGKNLILKTPDIKEYRAYKRKYSPDPADKTVYTYNEPEVDAEYEKLSVNSEWNPTVGIFTRNGEIIGILTFTRIVFSESRCELELTLANESYRGKGIGAEATELALKYAKDSLSLTRIYSEVPENNIRMCKMLAKCGFSVTKQRTDIKGNRYILYVKRV